MQRNQARTVGRHGSGPGRSRLVFLVGGLALAGAAITAGWGMETAPSSLQNRGGPGGERHLDQETQDPAPDPHLGPADVVELQLEALRKSRGHGRGIRQCYRFASPLNRAATGPIVRFEQMVRSPPYDVLLTPRDTLVGDAVVREERAAVLVTLIDAQRRIRVFRFLLTQQRDSPYEGCWMTDAVWELGPAGSALEKMPETEVHGI